MEKRKLGSTGLEVPLTHTPREALASRSLQLDLSAPCIGLAGFIYGLLWAQQHRSSHYFAEHPDVLASTWASWALLRCLPHPNCVRLVGFIPFERQQQAEAQTPVWGVGLGLRTIEPLIGEDGVYRSGENQGLTPHAINYTSENLVIVDQFHAMQGMR